MKELLYLKNNIGIINYTKSYPLTYDEVLNTEGFKTVLDNYLQFLKNKDRKQYNYLTKNNPTEAITKIQHILKALLIFDCDEITSEYLDNKQSLLYFIEDLYNYWRNINRFSLITTRASQGLQLANFIEADARFNQLVLSLYRTIEEKLQGRKNNVYRQLNAGTNACFVTREVNWNCPSEYDVLKQINFIDSIMLRTPLILHPKSNKRVGSIFEVFKNPIINFPENINEWFCYPAKIGELTAFIYIHRDFISSGLSLGNLFELSSSEAYENKMPDLICLFGVKDGKDETSFYYDSKNDIYVGSVSYSERIEYFGYLKKMSLTLHNLSVMNKKKLPIHGSMVNITLKNGDTKGIMFIGDSGAGKSETIEALRMVGDDYIANMDVVFDDMGSITCENNNLYAQGTEIGAFIRLDDLEKGTAYRDMDRSIFMNPESSNARVIIPATSYQNVISKHSIDMILYANNYDDKVGMHFFNNSNDALKTFVEGKRMALGTTQEKGLSTTYFANPFGPMQKQETCGILLNNVFTQLFESNIKVGEIYTRLGVDSNEKEGIKSAALTLLEKITGN